MHSLSLVAAPADRADYKRPLGAEIEDMAPTTEVVPAGVLIVRTMEESRKNREQKKKGRKIKVSGRGI